MLGKPRVAAARVKLLIVETMQSEPTALDLDRAISWQWKNYKQKKSDIVNKSHDCLQYRRSDLRTGSRGQNKIYHANNLIP